MLARKTNGHPVGSSSRRNSPVASSSSARLFASPKPAPFLPPTFAVRQFTRLSNFAQRSSFASLAVTQSQLRPWAGIIRRGFSHSALRSSAASNPTQDDEEEFDSSKTIFDVTDETFQKLVIDASHKHPVIVDCWATWCKPCRNLTPHLESAILDYEGKLLLAKIDVDTNTETPAKLGVTAIPAVFGYSRGEVIDRFVGGIPKEHVAQFAKRLVTQHQNPLPPADKEK